MKNIDWTILRKSISEDISKSERAELDLWLKDSKENADYYIKFKAFHAKGGKVSSDLQANYNRFINRVGAPRRAIFSTYLRFAASIVLLLSISAALYYVFNEEISVKVSSNKEIIKAGTKKALLYLGDNKVVKLESDALNPIKTSDGYSIQRDSNTLSYENIKAGDSDKISYNTIKIPRGGEYVMYLNDGTKVWINSETEIKFPIVFPKGERKVFIKGEAYFDVVKDGRPFIVNAGDMDIRVLGTEFNVRAYADESIIQATLVEGKVNVATDNNDLILVPGEQAMFCERIKGLVKRRVDVSRYTAWKEGRFIFEDERLEDILKQLERWYDVNIFYMNEELKNVVFRGNISRYKDVNAILEKIEKLNIVRFKIRGNTITVLDKQ